jgi:hypothetical protein
MDFFGILDAKKVIDLYLSGKKNLPQELNLVYPETTKLSEVAEMINNLSDYKVPIDILECGFDKSYCGSSEYLYDLGIQFNGLKKSLQYCYDSFVKNAK